MHSHLNVLIMFHYNFFLFLKIKTKTKIKGNKYPLILYSLSANCLPRQGDGGCRQSCPTHPRASPSRNPTSSLALSKEEHRAPILVLMFSSFRVVKNFFERFKHENHCGPPSPFHSPTSQSLCRSYLTELPFLSQLPAQRKGRPMTSFL